VAQTPADGDQEDPGGNLNPANADLCGWMVGIERRSLGPTGSCTNDAREPQRIEATMPVTQHCPNESAVALPIVPSVTRAAKEAGRSAPAS
jgi:hypothetical protein